MASVVSVQLSGCPALAHRRTAGTANKHHKHHNVRAPVVAAARAHAETSEDSSSSKASSSRRQALFASAAIAIGGAAAGAAVPVPPAFAADVEDTKMVGAYLPESQLESGFYEFSSGPKRTPALRAGALQQYSFSMPANWKELPVSNARSGNYCQPRCDEATTECLFGSAKEGSMQVIIIPTTKLFINKTDPTVEEVSSKENLMNAIGPAITGSIAVEEEEVLTSEAIEIDGKTYYRYELLTPFAEFGLHNVAVVTTSKNYVVIGTIAASEKQWSAGEENLKKIVNSFRI